MTSDLHLNDNVRVWPHGKVDQVAVGKVLLISSNQRSIAIAFDHIPPFASANGVAIHPDHGVMFFASRFDVGPWIEMVGSGHYEIEIERPS
jgi:hypothetical protein